MPLRHPVFSAVITGGPAHRLPNPITRCRDQPLNRAGYSSLETDHLVPKSLTDEKLDLG